eukprot:scaffold94350_cov62-Phaeocystis_antarctica.AAC.1
MPPVGHARQNAKIPLNFRLTSPDLKSLPPLPKARSSSTRPLGSRYLAVRSVVPLCERYVHQQRNSRRAIDIDIDGPIWGCTCEPPPSPPSPSPPTVHRLTLTYPGGVL